MTIVAPGRPTSTTRASFVPIPWHDQHPQKLDIEQQLGPDHLAFRIDQAVARLDLEALLASYGPTGSDPFPPQLLLRAVLFATQRGQHSPALWHRDATENNAVRWLLRGLQPSRSCWYAFRDRVAPLLLALNAQPLRLAQAQGLTAADQGSLDGTTVAANASRHKMVNEATLDKRAAPLDAAVANDGADDATSTPPLPLATPADDPPVASSTEPIGAEPTEVAPAVDPPPTVPPTEPAEATRPAAPPEAAPAADTVTAASAGGSSPTPPPAWMAKSAAGRSKQQQRYQQAQQRMAALQARNRAKRASKRTAADKIVVSLSDPEAVAGRDKEDIYRPLYNVQIVDDLNSPFVLAYEVFAQPNDAGVLGTMLTRVNEAVGHALRTLLADTAYAGGADLAAAAAARVTVYAPLPAEGKQPSKQIPKSAFVWEASAQTYTCPAGHQLEHERSSPQKRSGPETVLLHSYRCAPSHCTGCPLREHCTPHPEAGRTISRGEHEDQVEALRARMATAEAKALYRQRSQSVELVNADWKQHRKLRRFSGRGLTRARGQVGLVVLAHNLLTLLSEEKMAETAKAAVVSPAVNAA